MRPLRVASWNIRAAIGPGEPFPPAWWRRVSSERLARIAAVIHALDADVVALQEVTVMTVRGVLHDQPAQLAQLTGLETRYAAVHAFTLVEPESGRVIGVATWGNALLSRTAFLAVDAVGLPVGDDNELVEPSASGRPLAGTRFADAPYGTREPRCAIIARLHMGDREVAVLSTHLTYAGAGQRRAQAAALVTLAEAEGAPVVVAGDLNAPPEAPELAPLTSALDDAFTMAGIPLEDDRRASAGPARIDHILSRGLRAIACRVDAAAGDASDHLPVVADLVPADGPD